MDDPDDVAAALLAGISLLVRRHRATPLEPTDVTLPERSALSRLERGGPATAADLAKAEQISPQSMGSTLVSLERRGFIRRTPDPHDGRKVLLSLTAAGTRTVHDRRHQKAELLGRAIAALPAADRRTLTAAAPIIQRLAEAL